MYDVAILINADDKLVEAKDISINFHIAYVNPDFTTYQLAFRTFFTIVSLFVMCFYCVKVLGRVPVHL